MSDIDALASDLFATISAYVDKRVAAAVEKVLAEMQPKLDTIAKKDADWHGELLDEIKGTDGNLKSLYDRLDLLESAPQPKDGEPGKDGAPGKDAEPVDVVALAKSIEAAIAVPKDGINGKDGEDGRDGRDAIQCEVLDVIDPERRYQRGTFATHKGGLIRAFRATDPMGDGPLEKAGWAVVVEGIAGIEVKQGEDLRTFAIGAELTSGKAFAEAFTLPAMIHRGVFKAGTDYVRGDVATWDGSSWHCETATKSEPGNGSDWKLIAKRGANGKDGVGIRGEPGLPGKNGKDLTQLGPDGARW